MCILSISKIFCGYSVLFSKKKKLKRFWLQLLFKYISIFCRLQNSPTSAKNYSTMDYSPYALMARTNIYLFYNREKQYLSEKLMIIARHYHIIYAMFFHYDFKNIILVKSDFNFNNFHIVINQIRTNFLIRKTNTSEFEMFH